MNRHDREFDKFHNGRPERFTVVSAEALAPERRNRPLRTEELPPARAASALFRSAQDPIVRHHGSNCQPKYGLVRADRGRKMKGPRPSECKVTYTVRGTVTYAQEVVRVVGLYGVLQVLGVPAHKRVSVESAAARHFSLGIVGDFSLSGKWAVALDGPKRFQVEA